jgi:hypothetical protein
MVVSASVAEVVSLVTMGLGVMIAETGVVRGSIPSPITWCINQFISVPIGGLIARDEIGEG